MNMRALVLVDCDSVSLLSTFLDLITYSASYRGPSHWRETR